MPQPAAPAFHPGRKRPTRAYIRPAREMLLELLEKRSLSIRRASQLVQRNYETVRKLMRSLKEEGIVHITDYERGEAGMYQAIWALGDEQDASKPKSLTNSQKCKRWRTKHAPPPVPKDLATRLIMGLGVKK